MLPLPRAREQEANTVSTDRLGLHHMRIRTRIGFILIGVTYITTITGILAGCGKTFRKNWQIYPDPGSE